MVPDYWQLATRDIAHGDPVMAGFVERYKHASLVSRGDPFSTLVRSIVGQQISVKAADSVWTRLSAALPQLMPETVQSSTPEILRGCGLSARKVEYIVDLAGHFCAGQIHPHRWPEMSDAEFMAELTVV